MANPIVLGGYASPQSIYDVYEVTATNQTRAEGHHKIGTRGQLPDGRVFYYSSNGSASALTAGAVVIGSALTRSGSHGSFALTDSFANWAAGKQRGILLTNSDADADYITNEYAEGFVTFEQPDGNGAGHCYKIRGHTEADASSASTSLGAKFDLYDPIKVAADASDELTFSRNPWDRVILATTAEEELVVGVAPVAVTASTALATDVTTTEAATTTRFFWSQTWGPAAVECTSTSVVLGSAMMSSATADSLTLAAIATGAHTSNATTLDVSGYDRLHWAVGMVPAVDEAQDFTTAFLRICP